MTYWRAAAAGGVALLLALPLCSVRAQSGHSPPHQDLNIRLDPRTPQLFSAEAKITVLVGGNVPLTLGAQFEVLELKVDDQVARLTSIRDGERQRWVLELDPSPAVHRIELRYRGSLANLAEADQRSVLGALPPMASERGSFLPSGSGWYPEIGPTPFTYLLRLDLPQGQRGLVPGALVDEQTSQRRQHAHFRFDQPAEGIDLMAGPYRVQERELVFASGSKVRLRTYFHPEIDSLAAGYLDSSVSYLERYSQSIGPYPYAQFSIVSSPLPAGLGMPTLTYLGIDVLRLPFIRTSSLGHEVLHNWWGNGVNVDWARGNWCEGLTTFMADYAFKEDKGEASAREMRLDWLRDYAAVPVERDEPLRAFTSRTHDASQIVGYDKTAYVFLMLRDELGRFAFDAGIQSFWKEKRFQPASWDDLRHAFEQASGRELGAFFGQWIERKGAPSVSVEQARVEPVDGKFRVRVTLTQGEPAYRLRVPLVATTEAGRDETVVELTSTRQEFAFETAARPTSLAIDPEWRLFRRLDASEVPPILRQATLDPRAVTVLASGGAEFATSARALAARLMDAEPRFAEDGKLAPDTSALIIGLDADVDALLARLGLPARPAFLEGKGTTQVWTATLPSAKILLVVSARDTPSLQALLRPLPHYGRQSWLIFDGARLVERGVWPSSPVSWRFE